MASGPPFPPPYGSPPTPFEPPPQSGPGEYRWLAPASLQEGPGVPAGSGPARAPMYELRPLSTGEVLDRTFSLYRSRFLMFAGIAALAAAVRLVGQALEIVLQRFLGGSSTNPADVMGKAVLLSLPMTFVFMMALAVSQAATVWAMAEVYLGRSATVMESLRAIGSRWLRFLGIALWQIWSYVWLPLALGLAYIGIYFAAGRTLGGFGTGFLLVSGMLAALVVGFIFYLRNLLAVPAAVREDLTVRAAMRRSKVLSKGAKGKLFLVLLIAAALYFVMGIVLSTVAFVALILHRGQQATLMVQILTMGIVFLGYTLISPVIMIGVALLYFDQRVRREAFDVAVLLGDESALGASLPVTAHAYAPAAAEAGYAPTTSAVEPPRNSAEATLQTVLENSATEATASPVAAEGVAVTGSPVAVDTPVTEPEGGASGL